MKQSGAAIVARALADEGIRWTFGIPGTHNIELYDALAESDAVEPVLVTDEQSASFMADGVWRATNGASLGCVNVVPGAGLTHALSGIAEAWMDGVAMLVLACGIRRDSGKAFQLHDVDQQAIARPVTKRTWLVERGDAIYPTIREACAVARAGVPGPVLVEVPVELYLFRHDVDATAWQAPALPPPAPATDPTVVERAADLLGGPGVRPLLYLGAGAATAGAALVTLAERLQAPVATTFQGKGVFPESHPLFLWPGFGKSAPAFARDVAERCTATLAIGCRFGEVATGSYGVEPPQPLVHVDLDPTVPGRNYPVALAVAADATAFVTALLARLEPRREDAALHAAIRTGRTAVHSEWASRKDTGRVSPPRLLAALQDAFGPEAVYATDSGNGTFLAMECLRLERPGQFLAPVDYSCMGYAVPAAIGAKLARPDTPVIALAGDGAFLMTGLELLTAAHRGIGVVVIVLRDGELAQIAQFQRTALSRQTASTLPDFDASAIARGLGVESFSLQRDADIDAVLAEARARSARGQPVLIDAAIDYSEPTYFTKGVVKTNLLRLPWRDRLRFVGRALGRKLFR